MNRLGFVSCTFGQGWYPRYSATQFCGEMTMRRLCTEMTKITGVMNEQEERKQNHENKTTIQESISLQL